MGFSEALARKALLLCRNNVDAALEWVLQHMEDEDAEQPPENGLKERHVVVWRKKSTGTPGDGGADSQAQHCDERSVHAKQAVHGNTKHHQYGEYG
jgi:uncharacterized UBP type Zn finger protein